MADRWILGIDPGITGGLGMVHLASPSKAWLFATPTVRVTRGKKVRHEYDVLQMLKLLVFHKTRGVELVVLERGGTRPGQHAMAVFNTGYGVGLWYGLLSAVQLPIRWVAPQVWKRHHGLLKCDKRASRLLVQERWPCVGEVGPASEGAAEALLMADYYRVQGGFDGERVAGSGLPS